PYHTYRAPTHTHTHTHTSHPYSISHLQSTHTHTHNTPVLHITITDTHTHTHITPVLHITLTDTHTHTQTRTIHKCINNENPQTHIQIHTYTLVTAAHTEGTCEFRTR